MTQPNTLNAEQVRDDLVKAYPTKVARKRASQMVVNTDGQETDIPVVTSNVRTIPGIISQRGCTYAGCKGVVLGPTRDIINITHGPIGCGFYSWLTRRNQTKPPTESDENFIPYCFSTDMQEEDIVFGGVKRLRQAIQEAFDIFHPKAIAVFSTCPVGLIGDDVHAVAREMKEKLGINVFAFSCEGYRGVSQSAGHHIANNGLFKHVIGLDDTPPAGKFNVTMLGEYNIGGDAFVLEDLFERCGINLLATFSGNSSMAKFENAHVADLNVVMCHRSINYVADMIQKRFGVPWFKVNFIGAESSAKSLRKIAKYFEDRGPDRPGRERDRRGDGGSREGAERDPRPLPGQEGDALRRRQPGPPLPGPVPRDRHGDDRRGLRVRPPRRLRRPPRAADHQDRRRQPQHRGVARRSRSRAVPPPPQRGGNRPAWRPRACSSTTTKA